MLLVEVGLLLKSACKRNNAVFLEWRTYDLKTDWEPVNDAAWNRNRRKSTKVTSLH